MRLAHDHTAILGTDAAVPLKRAVRLPARADAGDVRNGQTSIHGLYAGTCSRRCRMPNRTVRRSPFALPQQPEPDVM